MKFMYFFNSGANCIHVDVCVVMANKASMCTRISNSVRRERERNMEHQHWKQTELPVGPLQCCLCVCLSVINPSCTITVGHLPRKNGGHDLCFCNEGVPITSFLHCNCFCSLLLYSSILCAVKYSINFILILFSYDN